MLNIEYKMRKCDPFLHKLILRERKREKKQVENIVHAYIKREKE